MPRGDKSLQAFRKTLLGRTSAICNRFRYKIENHSSTRCIQEHCTREGERNPQRACLTI